jgi:hypothetical protein
MNESPRKFLEFERVKIKTDSGFEVVVVIESALSKKDLVT